MRLRTSAVLWSAGLIAWGLSATVYAEPTAPSRQVVAVICLTPPCANFSTDGSPLNLNRTVTAEDGSTLTSSISAASTFGQLSAVIAAALSRLTPGTATAFVSVQMTDVLTIDSAPLTGTVGFLSLSYQLKGSTGESGIVNNETQVAVLVDRDGFGTGLFPEHWNIVYASSVSGLFTTTPFAFVYGQPFNVSLELNIALGTVAFGGTPTHYTAPVQGTGSGVADFSNALTAVSFSLFDGSMAPVIGATLKSGSGTHYTVTSVR